MPEALKVLIITPTYITDVTGNATTAHRLYQGLKDQGIIVEVQYRGDVTPPLQFKPHVIHALHALKGGIPAMKTAEIFSVPFVVTITGTDMNIDLPQSESSEILNVLDKASRVITYSRLSRDSLVSRLPYLDKKTVVIKPSVDLEKPKGKESNFPAGFNFLLPSGIRKVKDPSFPIRPLEKLRNEFPSVNLVILGPILDETEMKNLYDKMKGRDWIYYQQVGRDKMPDMYNSSDVVLNTSISEGLSNAVLEAMSLGKPVLASNCEGNAAVISHGLNGLLYIQGDESDFILKAKELLVDSEMRKKLGKAAKGTVGEDYSLEAEIKGHLNLYREILENAVQR